MIYLYSHFIANYASFVAAIHASTRGQDAMPRRGNLPTSLGASARHRQGRPLVSWVQLGRKHGRNPDETTIGVIPSGNLT